MRFFFPYKISILIRLSLTLPIWSFAQSLESWDPLKTSSLLYNTAGFASFTFSPSAKESLPSPPCLSHVGFPSPVPTWLWILCWQQWAVPLQEAARTFSSSRVNPKDWRVLWQSHCPHLCIIKIQRCLLNLENSLTEGLHWMEGKLQLLNQHVTTKYVRLLGQLESATTN